MTDIIPTPKMSEILLEEFMIPMNLSAYRLAQEIRVPVSRVQDILHDRRKITADTSLRLAKFFGAVYIVSSIGEAHLKDNTIASNEVTAARIAKLVPELEKLDMKLVLEVHGDHGTGAVLNEICGMVGSDRVLINYDTANAIFYGDVDVPSDMRGCLDRIGYVHLKDKAGGRKEWNFPALGKGYVPFPEIFAMMDEADNLSPYSIEIEFTQAGPKDLAEVNQAVMDSAEYLRSQGFEL